MSPPAYKFQDLERHWQNRWQKQRQSSQIGPPTPEEKPPPAGESPAPGATAAETHDDKKKPARRRGGRPKTHFVYPVPLVPELDGQLCTELRRFVAADVYARLQRSMGAEVFFPLGLNFWNDKLLVRALEDDLLPADFAKTRLPLFKKLLASLSVSIDLADEVRDDDPAYYRWTQWIFLQLMQRKLVNYSRGNLHEDTENNDLLKDDPFRAFEESIGLESMVGQFKTSDETAAASNRTSASRESGIWKVRVASYGDRLLSDLGKSNWPIEDRNAQRYRIGRLRGCDLVLHVGTRFGLEIHELEIFTTRVETLYGATFILVHPWHPIVKNVTEPGYEEDIHYYRKRIEQRLEPRISGVRTGGFAINPINLEKIPVLVSRLAMETEKGPAILGVPAHDPLFFELARRIRMPIREVLRGKESKYDVHGKLVKAFTREGVLTNSGPFNGLPQKVARERVIHMLSRRNICHRTTRFFLQEIPISRRSIWGVPVPIVHCQSCGIRPVSEKELPVLPPTMEVAALKELQGKGDLGDIEGFLATTCPSCGSAASRDTQVIADWVGRSWMFLRHLAPDLADKIEGMEGIREGNGAETPAALPATEVESDASDKDVAEVDAPAEDGSRPSSKDLDIDVLEEMALFEDTADGEPVAEESGPAAAESADDTVDDTVDETAVDSAAAPSSDESTPDDASTAASTTPPTEGAPENEPTEATIRVDSSADYQASPGEATSDKPSGQEEVDPAGDSVEEEAVPAVNIPGEAGLNRRSATMTETTESAPPSTPSPETAADSSSSSTEADGQKSGATQTATEKKSQSTREVEDDDDEEEEDAGKKPLFDGPTALHPFRKPTVRQWLPVDTGLDVVGNGIMGILETRFLIKFFYDIREVSSYEPFYRFAKIGHVLGAPCGGEQQEEKTEEGRVDDLQPRVEELLKKYGADALRLYLLSNVAISRPLNFNENDLRSIYKLLRRIWDEIHTRLEMGKFVSRRVLVAKHHLIYDLTRSIRRFRFHRAISAIYTFLKFLRDPEITNEEMDRSSIQTFLVLLWPLAPHLASSLWESAEGEGDLATKPWPEPSSELLHPPELEVPVKIDDYLRLRITVPAGLNSEKLKSQALNNEAVLERISGRSVKKVFAVPDRLVNILLEEPPAPDESAP